MASSLIPGALLQQHLFSGLIYERWSQKFSLGPLWTDSRRSFLRSWSFNYFVLWVHRAGGEKPQGIWGEEEREPHWETQNRSCGGRRTHFTYLTTFSLSGGKTATQEKAMCHVECGMVGQNKSAGQTHSLWQNGNPWETIKWTGNQVIKSASSSLKIRCHVPAISFGSFSDGVILQGPVDD